MQEKQEKKNAGKCRKLNSSKINLQQLGKPRSLSSIDLKRDEDSKYIVSYGGGINSTALIVFLVKNKFPLDYVVFSDTGDEMPETYEYLEVMRKYLDKKKIPFEIVMNRKREALSDKCLRRQVVPSQVWRWCTRDFKVLPIHKFYRSLKSHVYQYMGIDYGEVHRMKPSKVDYVTNLYPLIDHKINREECIKLIKRVRLLLPIKSGCFFCPYNNMERWAEIYKNHPDLYKFSMKIEENGKHMPKQKLAPTKYTLRQLEKMMKKKQELPMIQVDSPCGSECMV